MTRLYTFRTFVFCAPIQREGAYEPARWSSITHLQITDDMIRTKLNKIGWVIALMMAVVLLASCQEEFIIKIHGNANGIGMSFHENMIFTRCN